MNATRRLRTFALVEHKRHYGSLHLAGYLLVEIDGKGRSEHPTAEAAVLHARDKGYKVVRHLPDGPTSEDVQELGDEAWRKVERRLADK